jgi:sulfur-oxidizing protein SoxX
MKISRILLGAMAAVALVLTAGAGDAVAKKKKSKCKDGQPTVMASYKVSKGENIDFQISSSLTGKAGDPKAGLKWMVHRRLGNCIACHKVSKILALAKPDDLKSLKSYGFHGKIGPPLDGLTERYSEGEVRLIVVDAQKAFPDANTIMPAFHKKDGLHRVIKDCQGYVMMSAQQVEDIVAYLMTIK